MKNMVAINTIALNDAIKKSPFQMAQIAKILGTNESTVRTALTRGTMKQDMFERLVAIVGGKPEEYFAKLPTPTECRPAGPHPNTGKLSTEDGIWWIVALLRKCAAETKRTADELESLEHISGTLEQIATYTSQTDAKLQRLCEELLTDKDGKKE